MNRRWGEQSGIGNITVRVDELIKTLEQNRAKHHDVFERALVEFRKQATADLEELIEVLKSGKVPKHVGSALPIPEEHIDDYDRAIAMLRRHTEPTIVLSEDA